MSILVLPIKREWFDKIKRGEKTIEYREAKPYWKSRIGWLSPGDSIIFRNGYSMQSPQLMADVIFVRIVNGAKTDLHIDKPVYAIHFENVEPIEKLPKE